MDEDRLLDLRFATMAELAKAVREGIGRTALMKCIYFLQEVYRVPLGYRFGLYTYGPYDAQVLEDVKLAHARGLLESTVKAYHHGYGYLIKPRGQAGAVAPGRGDPLADYREALDTVCREFAGRSAVDLEMTSTLVFIDRELQRIKAKFDLKDLCNRVNKVKPHLKFDAILSEARRLEGLGIIKSEP